MALLEPGLAMLRFLSATVAGPARRRGFLGGLVVGSLALAGCASRTAEGVSLQADYPQAYYRTGSPLGDVSEDIERALRSVLRVSVQGTYETYVFEEEDAPTVDELRRGNVDVLSRAVDVQTSTLTKAASAIVVASLGGLGTLVTADHGINLPDTTVDYFVPEAGSPPAVWPVERISVKRAQENTVVGPSFVEPFVLMARSLDSDLALIGVALPGRTDSREIPRLSVDAGTPRRLSWGSVVYIMGHPAGYPMVTRATVSKAETGPTDEFLTDALLNEGSSGAPILAVRGDSGELEWVGMARAAASRTELRLEPRAQAGRSRELEPRRLYDGPIYLSQTEEIRYGITFSIPITDVRDFLSDQRSQLARAGFPVPDL